MYIAGLQKTSLLDYPEHLGCTVFVYGCNFRCPYCHNPELVKTELKPPPISPEDFFSFLEKRKKVLEAVTITGGEPTLYSDLPGFIGKIKKRKFLVKLDTNGTNPEMLGELIRDKLVDYIAMDVKAPWEKYEQVAGVKGKISGFGSAQPLRECGMRNAEYNTTKTQSENLKKIKKSIKLIIDSGIDYEFRSTILPALHTKEDVVNMTKMIKGAKRYYLQKFVNQGKMLDERFLDERAYNDQEMEEMAGECARYVEMCRAR